MSIHKSLIGPDKFGGHRNVLKRAERVSRLESEGRIQTDASVFGLPKIKLIKVKPKKKAEEVEETVAEGAVPGAAPAAGAAAATGAAPGAAGKAALVGKPAPAGKSAAAESKKEAKK